MYYLPPYQIVFQEVPGEISLAFQITGCPLHCAGCHSSHTWKKRGIELTADHFDELLNKYDSRISCVLFFGGEWEMETLTARLAQAKQRNLSTCLYTGLTGVPQKLLDLLTYVKTGPWIASKGGLSSPTTNQIFRHVESGTVLNYKFVKEYPQDAQTQPATTQ